MTAAGASKMVPATAFAAALLWPGMALAQTGWTPECKLHRVASLPMAAAGTVITVPVSVNGIEKNFLVDTGGYVSSVNQRVADELKLTPHEIMFNRIRDVSGKDATQYVWADTFKLGAMEARKFDLMVSATKNPRIDGVLSPDLLRNFDVEFDFAAMTLNLFRPHACDGQAVYWTKDFVSIPMELTKTGHTRVSVTVDGEEMDAIADTGASTSAMPFSSAARFFSLHTDSPGVERQGTASGSQGGELDTYRYPFKAMAIGPVAVKNPRLLLTDAPSVLTNEHVSMLLGMTEMRYLHLYFAYKERKLYISTIQAN